jgi:hypothetical protein
MSLESRREKIVFFGIVPVAAAICGSLITVLFTNSSCQLGPGTDFVSVLGSSGLTGDQKLKALEIYQNVTERPWNVVKSLVMILMLCLVSLAWAYADRIRGRK